MPLRVRQQQGHVVLNLFQDLINQMPNPDSYRDGMTFTFEVTPSVR